MSGANSFGQRFIVTTFGESHGPALGVVIDGVPAGIHWREDILTRELERRRPGSSPVVSARNETDQAQVLSGVYENLTLGTPIAIIVTNRDARSQDYQDIAKAPRPGHADDVWRLKFGHSDPRGGGRSSGRETVARVMAGAVARMVLTQLLPNLTIRGFARRIGPHEVTMPEPLQDPELCVARFPGEPEQQAAVETLLTSAKSEGLSYGGIAEIQIDGVARGLGQPVFHKLKADFASALLGVGASSTFELGFGFDAVGSEGSEFHQRGSDSRYGGIRGGISTGERITLRVGFKPTSSVLDVAKKGRHDPCIVPRAIPVLEAMSALVLVDHWLWARGDRL